MTDARWRQVEELYHAALGLPPEQRAPFLENASGGDSGLRREVESLLAQHDSKDSVFDLGPNDEPASPTEALLESGAVLGPYKITSLLGVGGMGQVYRAHDSRLQRSVAIKVLFPGQDARRFQREARAVAALSHPNVVPIFDVGHAGGIDYLVEELVEGESLRELLRRGPLGVARCRHLAAQIAEGLAAAHRAGIIHRDLKPGNIMVSREDCARILDFGLATSYRAGSDEAISVSQHGGFAGTAAYMSPEQVLGGRIDSRSDIFSYGALLYEMITGRQAFARDTLPATLTAVLEANPPPAGEIVAGLPDKLSQIIQKCLKKDREGRFQAIDDVRLALDDLEKDADGPPTPAPPAAPKHEPEHSRARIWLPAAAALMLIALTAVWFYSRTAHAPTEPNTVVLAEFDNRTGDPAFDYALKQALKIDLQQSSFLKILSDQQIADTLRQMGRRPDEGLTQPVAREVCLRTGGKAVLGGSVARLGAEYVLNLDALNCQTGEPLGQEQVRAGAKEEVLRELDKAASSLRGKLGESLSSIRRSDRPLNDFISTKSLEAFQAYVNGQKMVQQKGRPYGIPFFRRAADLDSNFAFAYLQLGFLYGYLGELRLSSENVSKAYGLREAVSEAERFPITAQYYLTVTDQPERAVSTCQVWIQTYPRDGSADDRVTDAYMELGQHEHALAESVRAYEKRGDLAITLSHFARGYLFLNRLEDARAIYQKNFARNPNQLFWRQGMYLLGFFDGNTRLMEEQVGWAMQTPGVEDELLAMHANTNAYFGHVEKSRELTHQAVEFSQRHEFRERAALLIAREALWEAWFGNSEAAARQVQTALGLAPGRDVRALAALALAGTGGRSQASKLADELDAEFPASALIHSYWLPAIRAEIELHGRNYSRAIELLRPTASYELADTPVPLAPVYVRGEAYLEAGQGEAASAEFQKILDHRGLVGNSPVGALARLGMARSYSASGETDKARSNYQGFFELWKQADADIPILRQARDEFHK
jgi:serine/threonine protein kinase/predicted Zn-dependent protease